jgi:hypothetical protein
MFCSGKALYHLSVLYLLVHFDMNIKFINLQKAPIDPFTRDSSKPSASQGVPLGGMGCVPHDKHFTDMLSLFLLPNSLPVYYLFTFVGLVAYQEVLEGNSRIGR